MKDETRYDFDAVVDRRGTHAAKWQAGPLLQSWGLVDRFDDETIPLFVADMDLPVARPVVEALKARVEQPVLTYSLHRCDSRYVDAFVGWYARRHGWSVDPGSVVQCLSVLDALRAILKAFTAEGAGVIIQPPVYGSFASTIESMGRRVVANPLAERGGRYTIDFEGFEALARDEAVSLFVLCSPHSPIGRVWTADELGRLAEICARNGVLVVADEVHGDLIRRGQRHVPFATVAGDAQVITCTSTNKNFNIAGLSCANIVIDDGTLRSGFSGAIGTQFPNPLTLTAVIAAHEGADGWLDQVNTYLDDNLRLVAEVVAAELPGVGFSVPEGTYSAWLDFRGLCAARGIEADTLTRRINLDANIVLEDGARSGAGGLGFQRMCVACPRPVLQTALKRLVEAVARWG